MNTDELEERLESIISGGEFDVEVQELMDELQEDGFGLGELEFILRSMERHERFDFGAPGAFVQLLEQFHGRGYEGLLVESIGRKPTSHTVWMLNRVMKGSRNSEDIAKYIGVMRDVSANAMADDSAREAAQHFLGLAHIGFADGARD